MASSGRLRLMAMDEEDLQIISAHVQDAVVKVGDIKWLPHEKRILLPMNRFAWEAAPERRAFSRLFERRRSVLHFERVEEAKSFGIDRDDGERVLSLLAVQFAPTAAPAGEVSLVFAGDAAIKLKVECCEARLADLGPAWSTPRQPRHMTS